ncbi:Hypothetical_protein [Hexamita inflata]|uniref:Hypothetical_protein n=1 Tax=Hexamita inflata TaxID=28002 RepID=A0AA86RHE5_9EUKA|nr:Hypothetical protein HINF_LOCUS62473 [Hexamita inflata]
MVEVVFENFVNYLRSGNTDKLNIISFQQNQQHKINLSTQLIFYRILTKTVVQLKYNQQKKTTNQKLIYQQNLLERFTIVFHKILLETNLLKADAVQKEIWQAVQLLTKKQKNQLQLWNRVVQICNLRNKKDAQQFFKLQCRKLQIKQIDNQSLLQEHVSECQIMNIMQQESKTDDQEVIKNLEKKQVNKSKILGTQQKFDQFTVAARQILNQMYSEQNFSNMSPKELCEFMNSQAKLANGFWDKMENLCAYKSKALQHYYSKTYSKIVFSSEKSNQNDKQLIQQITKEIFEAENGSEKTALDIAKQINELSFSKRKLLIADIEIVVAAELMKLKQ